MPNVAGLAEELRVVVGQLRRRLREQHPSQGLTWSQVSALGYLARSGPMTVTELADLEGVRSQSMGATLKELEKQHLVTFDKDAEDGRKKRFAVTDRAVQLLKQNRALRNDWLQKSIQSSLTDEEIQTLQQSVALLQRLAAKAT